MSQRNAPVDPRLERIFSHSLRAQILEALEDEGESSAARIRKRFGEKQSTISYHLSVLAADGAVEPARTVQSRGVQEYLVRITPGFFDGYPKLPEAPDFLRNTLRGAFLQYCLDKAAAVLGAEATGEGQTPVCMSIVVDKMGELELSELMERTQASVRHVGQMSTERLYVSQKDSTTRIVGLASFQGIGSI